MRIKISNTLPYVTHRLSSAFAKDRNAPTLKADAAESALCAYMAWIALGGLAVNAIWSKSWADPVAALTLLPLIVREGWEARKGKPCCH